MADTIVNGTPSNDDGDSVPFTNDDLLQLVTEVQTLTYFCDLLRVDSAHHVKREAAVHFLDPAVDRLRAFAERIEAGYRYRGGAQ